MTSKPPGGPSPSDSSALPGLGYTPPTSIPLPPFDGNGNLPVDDVQGSPPGSPLIHTSLPVIQQRFVLDFPDSTTRPQIWEGWMRHREALDSLGFPYATLVGGSFISSKFNPRDIDLCVMAEATHIDQLTPSQKIRLQDLLDPDACAMQFHCHLYFEATYPLIHVRFPQMIGRVSYWTQVFGIDAKGNRKGFLMLMGGGTL